MIKKGFYKLETKKKIASKKKPVVQLDNCEACGLYKNCKNPKMKYSGKGKKDILVISESPTRVEDDKGIQFLGESGKLIRDILKLKGINLDNDCYKIHAIACRTSPKKPDTKIINACRKYLHQVVRDLQPEKIIVLGKVALDVLIGDRVSVGQFDRWVGRVIPDQEFNTWLYITYNPIQIMMNEKDKMYEKIFRENISYAVDHNVVFVPDKENEKHIEIIKNPFVAIIFLQGILDGSIIAMDIEATGLKPHRTGHKIVTISIAISETRCFAFPMFDDKEFRMEIKKLLINPNIKKIAQNLKYEEKWLTHCNKAPVKNWYWDTMIATHILDNRSGVTGLKDQTYFQFGIAGYDNEVSPYLKAKIKGGNEFNTIYVADINKVLLYNGLDSLYTYRLYKRQIELMTVNDLLAYDLFHQGILTFANIEKNGITINTQHYVRKEIQLTNKINRLHETIMKSKEVEEWEKHKPEKFKEKHKKKYESINHNSGDQLGILLFDILGCKSIAKTAGGKKSTSAESLEGIKTEFVLKILEKKKLLKIRDTYLKGFIRETNEGKMYPSFDLNIPVTFRSSSSNPNFQNIPVRDKFALSVCRAGIIPSPGHQLVSVDYSGVEVKVSACNHHDPVMLAECFEPDKYDMHRDMAAELFLMNKEEVTKDARFFAKNSFVFAQFYGDYYVNCARNLWKDINDDIRNHLSKKGIKTYTKFENVVKDVEYKFWHERFKVYYKWKESTWKKYLKDGYIELLSGFVCRGHMRKNEILNYGIQGPAFHLLLWSMIKMNNYLIENKCRTKLIAQIHDEKLFDMCPKEKPYLKPVIKKIMTVDVKERFKWVIVPLRVDMETSAIDGNWSVMEKEEI